MIRRFVFLVFFVEVILKAGANIITPFINVSVKNVIPGKEFSLSENGYPKLRIYNKGDRKVVVEINTSNSFVKIEKQFLEIEPDSFAETDIKIFVPDEKKNYGKTFEAEIFTKTDGKISISLKSKLKFRTVKRRSFFKWLFGK